MAIKKTMLKKSYLKSAVGLTAVMLAAALTGPAWAQVDITSPASPDLGQAPPSSPSNTQQQGQQPPQQSSPNNFGNQGMPEFNYGPNSGPQGPNFGQQGPNQSGPQDQNFNQQGPDQSGPQGPNFGQKGPSDAQLQQMQQQKNQGQLKGIKSGTKSMANQLKQIESAFQKAEAKGTVIPDDIKAQIAQGKAIIDKINAATSMNDLADVDLNSLGDILQSLNQSRNEIINGAQMMKQVKQGMKNVERGIKMYETQINKLKKQNISIPQEITDSLDQAKQAVAAINNAKSVQEMQDAGLDNIQEIMSNLDQNRGQLEMLTRWPQTLKQMDSQIKRLNSELKRTKSIVDRLSKQGIDLSGEYTSFEQSVQQLIATRDQAKQTIATDAEEAFRLAEDDFFGQMDDVMQASQNIQVMGNLSQFSKNFKQIIKQSQSTIQQLKKKGDDTSDLESILNDANNKGNEILTMIKTKPVDTDSISQGLMDMSDLKQQFDDKVTELTGQSPAMPWEQGPNQFQAPRLQVDMNKVLGAFAKSNKK